MPSWKKVLISGSDAALNTLNVSTALTASGLIYPTLDGTSGQSIITDGNGNLSFTTFPTGSLITTASVAGSTITFTKGDGSTFPIALTAPVNVESASYIQSTAVDGPLGMDSITSASYALTASYGENITLSGSINLNGYTWPTQDGTYGVEVLVTDGAGGLTFELPTNVYEIIKNVTLSTIFKGTPVHATGSNTSGNAVGVIPADALDPDKMPATYIAQSDILAGDEGLGIAVGFITGVDTRGLIEGEPVYVGVGGGWTQTKPTGSALIQNLGIVTKVAENGSGVVLGAGRSNDVPNIQSGYTWVGNSDQVATATPTASLFVTSGSHALNADNAISASFATTASYSISTVTSSLALENLIDAQPIVGGIEFTRGNGDTFSINLGSVGSGGSIVTSSFSNVTTTFYNHNLGSYDIFAEVYDENFNKILPETLTLTSPDRVDITFSSPQTGTFVLIKGSSQDFESSSFTSVTSSILTHSLNTQDLNVDIYDSGYNSIIPNSIDIIDSSTVEVTFASPQSGYIYALAKENSISSSFSNIVSTTVSNTLGTKNITVDVYNNDYSAIIPSSITVTNSNVVVELAATSSGHIVIAGGQSSSTLTATTYKSTLTGASNYTIQHNLDEEWPLVQVYESSSRAQYIPQSIVSIDEDSIQLTFSSTFNGYVIIKS